MRRLLNILVLVVLSISVQAQDPQFTQSYAIPLYLGPSFAGSTNGSRLGVWYRNQWPMVPRQYITYGLAYDHNFINTNSGVGLLAYRDQAGSGILTTTSASLQYSYNLSLGRFWSVRPGLQMSFVHRSIDFSKLIFGDQLTNYGYRPASFERPVREDVNYVDFAASLAVFHEMLWFGSTVSHFARANESFLGAESIVPVQYTGYAGVKVVTNDRLGKYDEESVTITALYKAQAEYDQLDIGAYFSKDPLVVGLWYRGLPVIKAYSDEINHDAVNILFGYVLQDLMIGYSYDFTISRLISYTNGAHELTVNYKFFQDQRPKRRPRHAIIHFPKL